VRGDAAVRIFSTEYEFETRVEESESEVFGWSRRRIPKISQIRIFYPTPEVQLNHFLHHIPKLGSSVEMVQFLLKLLLKQKILSMYHDFH